MVEEVQEALELLKKVEDSTPWRFDEVNQPEKFRGSPVKFGAIRTRTSENVLQPFEGSSSIMMGFGPMVEFIVRAPDVIKTLATALNDLNEEFKKAQAKIEVFESLMKDKKE